MMTITAELSFYPLTTKYEDQVIAFIHALREHPNVDLHTGGTSTLVRGTYEVVFDLIKEASKVFFEGETTVILSVKYLNTDAFDTPQIP